MRRKLEDVDGEIAGYTRKYSARRYSGSANKRMLQRIYYVSPGLKQKGFIHYLHDEDEDEDEDEDCANTTPSTC